MEFPGLEQPCLEGGILRLSQADEHPPHSCPQFLGRQCQQPASLTWPWLRCRGRGFVTFCSVALRPAARMPLIWPITIACPSVPMGICLCDTSRFWVRAFLRHWSCHVSFLHCFWRGFWLALFDCWLLALSHCVPALSAWPLPLLWAACARY